MLISALNPDKKHLVRVQFADGNECFLDSEVCAHHALCSEMEITEEFLRQLKTESDYERAKSRALWYLDQRDYTAAALYKKLLEKGFKKEACAKVIARFLELEIIDDRRFAERFLERCLDHNISKRETLHKMLGKGVPYDLAKELLQENDTDEETQIRNLIESKYSSKLLAERGKEKVFAALARKGFSFSAIRSVLNEFIEESEYCEEYDV